MTKPDNPQAFPVATDANFGNEGMDLRDYFAAKAMQGLLSYPEQQQPDQRLAKSAYDVADAMLAHRER